MENITLNFPTITEENVISLLKEHEKFPNFYSEHISKEIKFASRHFYSLFENHREELENLSFDLIYAITSSDELCLRDEDQLLDFINGVYIHSKNGHKYSILYQNVKFMNITKEMAKVFIQHFDINDINEETWLSLSNRFIECKTSDCSDKVRYSPKIKILEFKPDGKDQFIGIINYLKTQSNDDFKNRVEVTASSVVSNVHSPLNLTVFDDDDKWFESQPERYNWICYNFKKNRVIPTSYQIKSYPFQKNWHHPKSWVIQGSIDGNNWTDIDHKNNCTVLNEKSVSHIFPIKNDNSLEFHYIRMKLTDTNWCNNNFLSLGSLEIYGQLK